MGSIHIKGPSWHLTLLQLQHIQVYSVDHGDQKHIDVSADARARWSVSDSYLAAAFCISIDATLQPARPMRPTHC
jgi:hypothetical protein